MRFERPIDEARQMRGQAICHLGNQIKRLDSYTYEVNSQSGHGFYTVVKWSETGWRCSCPDHINREIKCKHICAVEFSQALRHEVSKQVIIKPLDIEICLYCGSQALVKDGLRHNKNGEMQRFTCKTCDKWFVRNLGFERLKATPQVVTCALQLYFTGESLRNTQKLLRLQGVNVSHQIIYNWITRYVKLMEKYLDKITPQVSGLWRADELYLKIKGNMKYLFAMMDDETRYWIAQEVADSKYTHDARRLFQLSRAIAGRKPKILITDGLSAYQDAYRREFQTQRHSTNTQHIRQITIQEPNRKGVRVYQYCFR